MRLRHLTSTLIFSLLSFQAQAIVDMKNANFSDYWLDLNIPGQGYDLKVDRTYSSRSLFSGIFGFGWCSSLETNLTITMEGNLVLNECSGGLSISFYPASYNTKLINESVDRVLSLIRKKDPSKTKKFFNDLREQLRADHKLRTQLAGEVGVKISPVQNTVYLANGKEVDQIRYDGSFYVRTLADGTTQKFDNRGKLAYVYDKAKNYLRISYSGDLPTIITDNLSRKLSLSYYPEKKVKQIISSTGSMILYKFQGENLVSVTNAWKNTYNYSYDSSHNLTKISFPDGTQKSISYIENKDWVKEFRDRDGCVESFDFVLSQDNPKDHYWSTSSKNCNGKVVSKSRYEFWYQMRPDREKYLNRVLTDRNSDVSDIFYHQDFGKPISIRHNGDVTTFQYYSNGLVRTKTVSMALVQNDEVAKYSMTFSYDDANHITESIAEYYSKTNKPLRKRKTNFKYDGQGRLASARSSEGHFIEIGYNSLGLISSIADQAKKEIVIEYDKTSQRPSTITRPSVGSIQLSYGPRGEIKKVRNKGGSSVNTQVYAAFNNFVDMVGPVATELNVNL